MLKQKKLAGMMAVILLALSSLSAKDIKPNGCDGPVLCPSFPIADRCSDCSNTWHIDIGLLYQQPGFANMSPGFGYVPVFQNPTGGSSGDFVNQEILTLEECFNYQLGVTASLGHLLQHDNWYLGANFDYLGASRSTILDNDTYLYRPSSDFAFNAMTFGELQYQYGYWNQIAYSADTDIYTFGVLLSRGSYLSNCFSYEPYAGIRALWFDLNQTKNYQEPDNVAANSQYILTSKQDNWGVGPMFGMNGEYHITEGISLFSDSYVGVLYGENRYQIQTFVSSGADINVDRFVVNKGVQKNVIYVPVRTILGIKLSTYCIEERHYVALKIGYDANAVLSPSNKSLLLQTWEVASDGSTPVYTAQQINLNNGFYMAGLFVNLIWDF